MDQSPHISGFVTANGFRLHYLDWGGQGTPLVFLPGMGCNAHIFDTFAPRFTDRHRVLALTRRGHGESDHPETGYDVDTLAGDVVQALDALGLERVVLAGHSLAGIELTRVAAYHPERVAGLVYLEAAYNRAGALLNELNARNPLSNIIPPGMDQDFYSVEAYYAAYRRADPAMELVWDEAMETQSQHEVRVEADGRVVDAMSDAIGQALYEMMSTYVPEDRLVKAPALSFFSQIDGRDYLSGEHLTAEQRLAILAFYETDFPPQFEAIVAEFQSNMPQARVVVIPHGHHYCFIRQEALVFAEMRKFLEAIG